MDVNRSNQTQLAKEEERWASYMAERRSQQNSDETNLDAEYGKKAEALTHGHQSQLEEMDKAFKVDLSRQREGFEKALAEDQKSHEKILKTEAESHEKEFEKVRERERARIDLYRRNQDEQLEKLHDKYQAASEDMQKHNS
jgi:hypothetical protein